MNFGASKPEGSGGGVKYLKFKDGDSHVGVFRGEPQDYRAHWVGKSYVTCPEDKSCLHCADGPASFRFEVNFVVKENGALVSKVWGQGRTVYESLSALQKSGYDLEKTFVTFVRVSRKGSTKDDTSYSVVPLPGPQQTPTADQLGELDKVDLHDLSGKPKDSLGTVPEADVPNFDQSEPPF